MKIGRLVEIGMGCFALGALAVAGSDHISSKHADESIQYQKDQLVKAGVPQKQLEAMEKRANYYSCGHEDIDFLNPSKKTPWEYVERGGYWQEKLDSMKIEGAKEIAIKNIEQAMNLDGAAKKAAIEIINGIKLQPRF